jgi:hypothetical protein
MTQMGADSDLRELQEWFTALSSADRVRFLAYLLSDISIAGRAAYRTEDGQPTENAIAWLTCCNELLHTAAHQLHTELRSARGVGGYPPDVFIAMLFDVGRISGVERLPGAVLRSARERAGV